MPDFILLTQAGLAAAIAAGIVYLLLGWPPRRPGGFRSGINLFLGWPWLPPTPARLNLGWTFGIGLGFYTGCWVLDILPSWPPANDKDRLLVIVIPAALLVESVAACAFLPGWLVWVPRCLLAAAVMPILLYGKGFYEDSANPGTVEWPLPTALKVILILAELLLLVWFLLDRLQARASEKTVGAALCLTSATTGAVVMFWGYLSGGLLGIPLAGALAGVTTASFLTASPANKPRFSGVGLVGLYSILILGRFIQDLPTVASLCLLVVPLAPWIAESSGLRHLGPRTHRHIARSWLW